MPLRVNPFAQMEAYEAADAYETRRPGLGDEFIDSLTAAYAEIEKTPLRFPRFTDQPGHGYRLYSLVRFPYVVIYESLPEEAVVVAVAHTSRRPNYWRNRKG